MRSILTLILLLLTVGACSAQYRTAQMRTQSAAQPSAAQPSEAHIQKCCFLFGIARREFDRYRENPVVQQLLQQIVSQNQRLMDLIARIEDRRAQPIALPQPQQIYGSPLAYNGLPFPSQNIVISVPPGSPQQFLPQTPPQQQFQQTPPLQQLPQTPPQQRLPVTPPQQQLPQAPPQQALPQAAPQQSLPTGPPAAYQQFSRVRRSHAIYRKGR